MRIAHLLHPSRVALVVSWLLVPVGLAHAGEPRTHDGFFLRLSTGGGTAKARIEPPGGSAELSGGTLDVNLAVGGRVAPNLLLHGTVWGWTVTDPEARVRFDGLLDTTVTVKGDLDMTAVGVGLTYYFMPANAYVSASVGTGSLSGDHDLSGETNDGLALDLTVGKEWWVSDGWGLGAAVDVGYFSAKDKDLLVGGETWSGPNFGLRLSATFN